MDDFSNLPSLALINIIVQMDSERGILQLIRASPVMLQHYVHNRHTIIRERLINILANDTDGDILQDAQAILHSPPIPALSGPAMSEILESWSAKALPDPLSQRDPTGLSELYHFFSRVTTFIEDYLAKALDPFPARACMTLPDLSLSPDPMRFKGRAVDIKPVAFGAIKQSKQFLLLRTFVRYELLCKVYWLPSWEHIKGTVHANAIKRARDNLTLEEYEALFCIEEYFKSLYGAVYAHFMDAWLPDRPANERAKSPIDNQSVQGEQKDLLSAGTFGLIYPDNVYFNASLYVVNGCHLYWFPLFGLDIFCSTIRFLENDNDSMPQLIDWFHVILEYLDMWDWDIWDYGPWILEGHSPESNMYLNMDNQHIWNWDERMELSRTFVGSSLDNLDIEEEHVSSQERAEWPHNDLQLRIYRQRAWVFFDGSEPSPYLPTSNELQVERRAAGDIGPCTRTRRRSQRWQDYWSGQSMERPDDEFDVPSDEESDEDSDDEYDAMTMMLFD